MEAKGDLCEQINESSGPWKVGNFITGCRC